MAAAGETLPGVTDVTVSRVAPCKAIPPFLTERHGPGCAPDPPFAMTGTVPIRWAGAMTFKMLFLIALMAPILLIAMGALIHGPDHASTTEQD